MRMLNTASSGLDQETRQRILHCAVELFAAHGFNGTTLRDITVAAGANLASVNYYFRSKDDLIISAIEEAVIPLVAARLAALETCIASNKTGLPTVDEISKALVKPLFDFCVGENRNRLLLLMQVRPEPTSSHNAVVVKHFAPLHEKFVAILALILPELPKIEIAFRYDCARGAALQSLVELAPARTLVHFNKAEKAVFKSELQLLDALVRFVSAGFQAPPTSS